MDTPMLIGLSIVAFGGLVAFLCILIKNRKVSKDHVFMSDMLVGDDGQSDPAASEPEEPAEVKEKMEQEDVDRKHFDVYK
jgi:hypothetical protein